MQQSRIFGIAWFLAADLRKFRQPVAMAEYQYTGDRHRGKTLTEGEVRAQAPYKG